MSGRQPFEQRLAAWLGEGPLEAPERIVDEAAAHARTHPRAWSRFGSVRRTIMTPNIGLPANPWRRPWFTAAVAVAAVLVVEVVLVGGASVLGQLSGNRGAVTPASASPASSAIATAPATPAPSVWMHPPYPGSPVHVKSASANVGEGGVDRGPSWLQWTSNITATDARLSGCLELQSAVGVSDWTWDGLWGVAAVFPKGICGYLPMSDTMSTQPMSWEGEWFTAGPRQVTWDDPEGILPVDTVWLHGRGENEGLTAVLNVTGRAEFDGWIFATPTAH